MVWFWTILSLVIGLLTYFEIKLQCSTLFRNINKHFKGPKYWPIVGNSFEFLGLDGNDIYAKVQELCEQYEGNFRFWLGSLVYIVMYNVHDVETILSNTREIKKSDPYTNLQEWLGTGLLTSDGSKWKSRRKIITPTFHFKILEDFLPVFNRNGLIFIEKLSELAGTGAFDIYALINLYSLDIIAETAMGVQINAQKNSDSEYVKAVKTLRYSMFEKSLKIWLANDLIFRLTKRGREHKKAINFIHANTNSIIRTRRKKLCSLENATGTKNDDDADYIGQKKRLAFLDLLILCGELSDADIREEVDTFMFEGHDTVTSALSFAFYCLAHNQKVQENVYREQLQIFGESDRDPTMKDLLNMKYLEMVIKESLRTYPSVPIIGRTIEQDLPLKDGRVLPKGCRVTINVAKLHRDPTLWSYPNEFNPDNFLPEMTANRNSYAYVPFSAGLRNCIGQKFAMLEMKTCIGKVIRKFKINPSKNSDDDPKITGQLILFSNNGVHLEIEKRK